MISLIRLSKCRPLMLVTLWYTKHTDVIVLHQPNKKWPNMWCGFHFHPCGVTGLHHTHQEFMISWNLVCIITCWGLHGYFPLHLWFFVVSDVPSIISTSYCIYILHCLTGELKNINNNVDAGCCTHLLVVYV